jgi:hypothetical protein
MNLPSFFIGRFSLYSYLHYSYLHYSYLHYTLADTDALSNFKELPRASNSV